MNENGKKRREWVKTAAIVFLSIMLVLTFFSNSIMNYSLPEVAAQYVQSGTITAKIRGTGTVESGDPYNVMVKETRKVTSVAVKVGDQVQKGDVLVYLEDSESTELDAARKALEAAKDAYDTALLAADVNAQVIQNAGSNTTTTSYRQQINDAQAEVEKVKKDVAEWQARYDKLTNDITLLPENDADTSAETKAVNETKKVKDAADQALQAAQNELTDATAVLEYQISVSAGDATIEATQERKKRAELDVINKKSAANAAALAYEKACDALDNKKVTGDNSGSLTALKREQNLALVNLEAVKKELTEKETALTELTSGIAKTLNLQSLYEAVVDASEEVAKQEEKSIGGTVTADIAGTITSMNAAAGKEISALEPVAVLQPEGKGYTMSFSVTNEQAKRLSVGDKADLVNSWRYDDVNVTLASIKPDKTEPGKKKLLTFDVTGDVTAGQTLNVSVGQKSANYDLIVPNSAIREDNNGKFVLIVQSKSSPLGNRYVASRVDVEVLASDDTQSAISGALYGYEFVITTSNKPVEAGKLVRLSEN